MRQSRVGCGHKALGLALGVKPEAVRVVADRRLGADRGIGLFTYEAKDLAAHMGGQMAVVEVPRKLVTVKRFGRTRTIYQGPTVSTYVRQLAAECRAANEARSYIIHVRGHFVGASIGVRGHVAWVGAQKGWMKRARVLNAYRVTKMC